MVGLIYKMTITDYCKISGNVPFYVGQHWCKSEEQFLRENYPYWGCGSIWQKYLKRLKKLLPKTWKEFVKREILCCVNSDNQKVLDKLEEYYIKKNKSLYSEGLGGCNVLPGTANGFGSGSPVKDPFVRKKISEKAKGRKFPESRKKFFHDMFSGEGNPFYGKRHTEETREKISEFRKSLPKKYKIGEMHPSIPNKVWTEYKPGKFDWRAKDRKLSYSKKFQKECRQ